MAATDHKITVLIADDQEIIRRGIRDMLEQAGDIQVLEEARDGEETRQMVAALRPQILLLDMVMPHHSPVELERWVRSSFPETITLVLTAHDRDVYLSGMVEAGAAGYLNKQLRAGELIAAIRRVARGEFVYTKEQLQRARKWREETCRKLESLSDRERQVLQRLTEGKDNQAIAAALRIEVHTVEKHLTHVYKKLGVRSRSEAILWWMDNNTQFP